MEDIATLNSREIEGHAERTLALNDAARRLMQRVLGCWQHDLSRPFSHRGQTYRVCVKCGLAQDVTAEASKTHIHPDLLAHNPSSGSSMSADSLNRIYRETLQSLIENQRSEPSDLTNQTSIGIEHPVREF